MITFSAIQKVCNLPDSWNMLAANYFQRTEFLCHAERYNPCKQRYYLCMEGDNPLAAAVVYSLRLDILTFIHLKSPIKTHIIGIPCSVSSPGIFGTEEGIHKLKDYIFKTEKGFVLALNLESKPDDGCYASGKTLPTIVMENRNLGWDDYITSLRSDYRRRLNKLFLKDNQLTFNRISSGEFNPEMYLQYLEVYKRSEGKLEKLSHGFFKNLPSEFIVTTCSSGGKLLGWNIALSDHNIYYFFLGGIDYSLNKTYNTYLRLLAKLIEEGINAGARTIELGQTAEIPKMRMGGNLVPRYMEAHHSIGLFDKLLKINSKALEYKRKLEEAHPLKEGGL
jgi:hypothetical protein